MKKNTRKRVMMLSLAMAAMLALPTMASAQKSRNDFGGLFGTNPATDERATSQQGLMNGGGTRDGGLVLGGTTQENPSNTATLGSGLIILVAAATGYVALKKKEETK